MFGNSDVSSDLFVTPSSEACLTAEKLLCFGKVTTAAPEKLIYYNNLKRFIALNENVKG